MDDQSPSQNTEEIRRVVREELSRNHVASSTNLYSRTQDLIKAAAQDVRNVNPASTTRKTEFPSTAEDVWGHPSRGRKRSVPGHPGRFISSQKKTRGGSTCKPKTVHIVLYPEDLEYSDKYRVDQTDELLNGFIELLPHHTEIDVRNEVLKIVSPKYPLILSQNFDFMKKEKNVLSKPLVSKEFKWNYDGIKALVGQGKLCCRLNVDILSIIEAHSDHCYSDAETKPINNNQDMSGPSSSSHYPIENYMDEVISKEGKILKLKEMFPLKSENKLKLILTQNQNNLSEAIIALSTVVTEGISTDSLPDMDCKIRTLSELLDLLSKKLSSEKDKIKVDVDDLLNDALSHYKDPELDMTHRIRVQYRAQPAADTGGVMRQFFSDVLQEISKTFFVGDRYKLPIYNASAVASGIMKYIGYIIVHSILQGGPGLRVFSLGVYEYIATGDIDEIISKINVDDCSLKMKDFIHRLSEAADVETMDKEESVGILEECGLMCLLTNDNKMSVIQSLIVHDVIGRRKIVLDQLANGLEVLGFRDAMKNNKELFSELFVVSESVNSEKVIECLSFGGEMKESDLVVKGYLLKFLKNCSSVKQFLEFSTGSPMLPCFGLGKIHVTIEATDSIFSSVCTKTISLPNSFNEQKEFDSALLAVMRSEKHFNCI